MGIFSKLASGIGNVLGIGESSTKYARKAGEADIQRKQQGLDFTTDYIAPFMERSEGAAGTVYDFYSGAPGVQRSFIESAKQSPFYEALQDEGMQAVGSALSATGNVRGGIAPTTFNQQGQKTLMDLVNRNVSGLERMSQPVNLSTIAQQYSDIGDAEAGKYQAVGQAKQDKYGNILSLGKTIAGFV